MRIEKRGGPLRRICPRQLPFRSPHHPAPGRRVGGGGQVRRLHSRQSQPLPRASGAGPYLGSGPVAADWKTVVGTRLKRSSVHRTGEVPPPSAPLAAACSAAAMDSSEWTAPPVLSNSRHAAGGQQPQSPSSAPRAPSLARLSVQGNQRSQRTTSSRAVPAPMSRRDALTRERGAGRPVCLQLDIDEDTHRKTQFPTTCIL